MSLVSRACGALVCLAAVDCGDGAGEPVRDATVAMDDASDAMSTADGASGDGAEFIALQRDFAGFLSWTRTDLGDLALAGHPPGPRAAYVNHPLAPGLRAYPVGSIIVKAITPQADEQTWDLFAMVKRGGGFNADGARGWEFFTLHFVAGVPVIVSRGTHPTTIDDDTYGTGNALGCNGCHATGDALSTDSILSPALRPQP